MRFRSLALVFFFLHSIIQAQDSSATIHFDGYAEAYFCYDLAKPATEKRQDFFYSYNRDRLPQFNLTFLRASSRTEHFRTSVAMMSGTYAEDNLSGEPAVMRAFYECSAGIRIRHRHEIWLDAGVFPSHIGFESAIGKDCASLTRSMMAENSPYFESGIRLSGISKNERWNMAALLLNGWQRIRIPAYNFTPAFGTQISFEPIPKLKFNSSSYAAMNNKASNHQYRLFHNFFVQYRVSGKWNFTAAWDFGLEKTELHKAVNWHCGVLQAQYLLSKYWRGSVRAEYFSDINHVMISAFPGNAFQVSGCSANIDYFPQNTICLRLEYRLLRSPNADFISGTSTSQFNHCLTTALALSF